jgi:RNA binding exosome subunit
MARLEVTIDVIVHATEDSEKFFKSFNEMFYLEQEIFSISTVSGHFNNPIKILTAKVTKKSAYRFMEKFLNILSENQKNEIIQGIEERTENSNLHIRLDKQKFIQGQIAFIEKEAIKIKIQTPIYNKKDTIKVFSRLFQDLN